ncbi:Crp/Fnr family transcriptional regulator [Acidiluteibacter ferrifornacis]|uniref:Cyclic nucleotide-binding domain-containing protein n=1 Tax=Acidiluteibacter ferrifornacis TaxID=2692424 RepID=A0A6N9NR57_9FLAO|nr:cyclic nucleotide-binding domain-containing protein [Acidiluteibacter ferrifornacis]NBG66895.1 cyclic nucleotide-binding domain-containing protein [Acidiluteibacter ferrifornacis]|tara:strand:+ start:125 stop:685 length:561 start_codon:yes stop_codon:yes gene_type:complete
MKAFLNKIEYIDQEILDKYISYWTEYTVPKKTIMTAPGETERYMYYVIEGIQKSYYLNEDKQHVMAFTYPPSFSGIPESFLTQTPSRYFLETITESSFFRISFEKHQELMQEHREIETLFRKATELVLIGMVQRHYELMAFNISQRFKSFAQRSPHLFSLVSHKDLASYLRIDSTNFSKLFNTIKI